MLVFVDFFIRQKSKITSYISLLLSFKNGLPCVFYNYYIFNKKVVIMDVFMPHKQFICEFNLKTQPTTYLRVCGGLGKLKYTNSQGVPKVEDITLSFDTFKALLTRISDSISLKHNKTYEVCIEFVDEYQRTHTKHRLWSFDKIPLLIRLFAVLRIMPNLVEIARITIKEAT